MGDEVDSTHDLNAVLGTIFLFLKNQNFFKSSEAFRNDCEAFGIRLPNISGKVFFRTDEKVGTIDDCTYSSKKFVDKRIILETFLERDYEEIQTAIKTDTEKQRANPSKRQQESLRNKFGELQEDYRNLLAVTSELTNALQLNIVSQAKNVNLVLDQCKTIYPSLFQTPRNVEGHEEMEVRVEEKTNAEKMQNRNLESVATNNLMRNNKTEPSRRMPCIQMPSSDISTDDNEPVFPNKSQAQVSSTISQSEVKDILDTVFNDAIYLLKESKKNDSENCCGDENACTMCTNEISKMLDKILVKVMASPRCESGASDCCHSKDNSVFRENKTPNTERSDVSIVKFQIENKQTNPDLNIQKKEGESHEAEVNNNVGEAPMKGSDAVPGLERQIFCKSRECPNRPRSAGGCRKEKTVAENIRCRTWSHLDYSNKESQLINSTKEGEIVPKSTKIEQTEKKYDEPLQPSQMVHSKAEMRNSTSIENHPAGTVTEKKRVKPIQQFVKFQTPLCYLETCRRIQDGNRNCRCTYCVPGKNRYYCGCYDVICKEITEDADGIDEESTCRKLNFFKNLYDRSDIARPKILEHYMCERPCNAFESRPKIRRTPPE